MKINSPVCSRTFFRPNFKKLEILSRILDEKSAPFVVAELSGNHGGGLDKALKLVSTAKEAGADAIKLQTYRPDTITVKGTDDRFMLKTIIDYPKIEDEQLIVRANINNSFGEIKPVVTVKQIIRAQESVRKVYMDEKIEKYILDLVFATRYPEKYGLEELKPLINFGASPRGSINLANASRCYAFIKRRGYVVPEDVRAVIHDVLRHRIGLTYEAEAENISSEEIINKIVNKVEVP